MTSVWKFYNSFWSQGFDDCFRCHYRINVSASDGKFNATSLVKVNVDSVSDEALDRSAIVRFREVSAEDFILKHRRGFLKTVRHALGCRIKDIVILSVQPSNDAAVNDVIKSREVRQTAVHNDLDVLFAVKKSNTQEFFTSENIRESLNQHVEELEASTKLVVEEIVRYKCTKSHCIYGECRDTVILDYNKVSVISTDVVSFVLPRHRHHIKCLCKEGYKGQYCEVVTNECARKPCPAYKVYIIYNCYYYILVFTCLGPKLYKIFVKIKNALVIWKIGTRNFKKY